MIKEYFALAFESLRQRRLRSWLTIIGIFIGIAAVVAMYSLGQGLQVAIQEQFEKVGADKLNIQPSGGFGPPGAFTSSNVTDDDIEIIRKVRGVEQAAGVAIGSLKAEYNDKTQFMTIRGMPTDDNMDLVIEARDMEIDKGRLLQKNDHYSALIGSRLAEEDRLFGKNLQIRDKIILEGIPFEIVGSLKTMGSSVEDTLLMIPLETLREILDEPEKLNIIIAKTESGAVPEEVAERIKKEMRRDRDQDEGDEDFEVQTFEKSFEVFTNIFLIVTVVVLGITAISLIIGAVGIMNTMYTAVIERTREVGIMKAVGARNHSIALLFLIESGMLGLFGGAIGIMLGVSLSKVVEYLGNVVWGSFLIRAYFPWYLIVGMLVFSFLIGAGSGFLPALQASKMNVVDALRKR